MHRYVKAAGRGAVAGLGATVAMTAFMMATRAVGALGELPPRKITKAVLHRLGIRPSDEALAGATIAAHLGFGAVVGAAMETLREAGAAERTKLSAIKQSSAVWAGAYQGVVPASGIMRRPKHDRPLRPTMMLVAHWIYGAVFDELSGRLA